MWACLWEKAQKQEVSKTRPEQLSEQRVANFTKHPYLIVNVLKRFEECEANLRKRSKGGQKVAAGKPQRRTPPRVGFLGVHGLPTTISGSLAIPLEVLRSAPLQEEKQSVSRVSKNSFSGSILIDFALRYVCPSPSLSTVSPTSTSQNRGANSQLGRGLVYKPHSGPRSIVDLASFSGEKQTSPQ